MKYAKVITKSLAIHDTPAGKIVGYLEMGERVKVVGEPITHRRTWWPVEQSNPSGVLRGWAAQGDDDVVWLQIDMAEKPMPPDWGLPELHDTPVGMMPWWPLAVGLAIIGAVALIVSRMS
jgi:hypothetical protein